MDKDSVMTCLYVHREELVRRAQKVVDEWNWLCGGACDEIARVLVETLDELEGIDAYAHGQDGGDHTWVVIPVEGDVIEVDIPWDTYEEKLGYRKYGPTHRRLDVDDIEFTVLNLDPELLALGYA